MVDRSPGIVARGSWLALLVLSLLAVTAQAARDVPPIGRVVDQAKLLDASGRQQVENTLKAFEAATGGQMAVLIIPSLDGDSLEGYSIRVAEKWALGDKARDDGLLLLIVVNDRKTRIEVGQGFEGSINDAKAGDMLRALAPYFREQRYADGIVGVIDTSARHITGKGLAGVTVQQPTQSRGRSGGGNGIGNHIVTILVILVILLSLFSRGGGDDGTYSRRGRRRSGGVIIFGGGGGGGFSGGGGGGGFSGGGGGFSGGGASGGW